MPRVLCLALSFVLLGFSGCPAQNKVQEQDYSDTWDFGRVKEGLVLEHGFVLRNQTSNTLNIKEIHTSCGCTASEADKKILEPEEETLIKVKFNSKGYSGLVRQFVYVHTDDPDNPIVKLNIIAEVYKD